MPKSKKHPRDMTTQEAAEHLFHPKILAKVKEHLAEIEQPKRPKKPSSKD